MKKLAMVAVALLGVVGLTACVDNSTPERQAVVKEMVDFQKKCKENPNDKECVEFESMYRGGN